MNAKTELATEAAQFKDKKRKLWMLGLVIPNIANVAMLGYQFGPKKTKKLFAAAGPLVLHGLIPLLDKYIGQDPENPPRRGDCRTRSRPVLCQNYSPVYSIAISCQPLWKLHCQ